VATFGGSPTHPKWFLNIERHPEVTLQDGPVARPYTARILSPDDPDLEVWWERAVQVFPAYGEYRRQLKGVRDVPLVVAEPV
jgi:deazaflavin-dependent oxidoreductase (nitroreductase family)